MAKDPVADRVDIESGTAVFEATTNVPGVEVKGKSGALRGRVAISHNEGCLLLDEIDATVPVKSLSTGMGVRDEHMRKYIFTTGEPQSYQVRCDCAPGKSVDDRSGSAPAERCHDRQDLTVDYLSTGD